MMRVSIARLLTLALLLIAQPLYAETEQADHSSAPSQAPSGIESEAEVETEVSQALPVVVADSTTVPLSDAVKEAALLMRPSGATLEQVVTAMVRLNPAVFVHGELQHATLTRPLEIPSVEQVLGEDPAGLERFLQQLDVVTATTPLVEPVDSVASLQALSEPYDDAAGAGKIKQQTEQKTAQKSIITSQVPAVDGFGGGSIIPPRVAMFVLGAVLLLLMLMWMLYRLGRSKQGQPLSISSSIIKDIGREPRFAARITPRAVGKKQRGLIDPSALPEEYHNYDDIGELLQRVVAESEDAPRQVLQLMRVYRLQQDREGFLRQHQQLLSSGFYQLHAEARAAINQDAVALGLKLDAVTASDVAENRIQQLQARVESAEKAKKAAEQRASKAESKLRQMQLDFGGEK